ncbi:Unknown protein, partial [Striga hermonthica]
VRRFQEGLLPAIRHHVAGHCIQTYADIVVKAQEVDACFRRGDGQVQVQPLAQVPAISSVQPMPVQQAKSTNKRKWKGPQNDQNNKHKQPGQANRPQLPACGTCGRPHRGECLAGRTFAITVASLDILPRILTTTEVVAQFCGYNPEIFSGQGDPRLVEEWNQGLESILEITECTDRHRILCAQLQMTGDARLWWNSYWGMRPGEKENLTWTQFKEILEEKYYPTHYRAEMERQFLALVQGSCSVGEK